MTRIFGTLALTVWLAAGVAGDALAQGLESLGARPAAMAAFVAVADDASAVAWNPAGLVSGPFFNMVLDFGRSTTVPDSPIRLAPAGAPAGRVETTLIALGVPPLGLSYYRLAVRTVSAAGPQGEGAPDRQDRQVEGRVLETRHLGVTVLQSVGEYLTLGATAKLVRGRARAGNGLVASWDDGFDRLDGLDARGSTTGDVDVGLMASAGRLRVGVVGRNLTEPTFELGGSGVELSVERHLRAGLAWGDRWPGTAPLIVAVDADLTRVSHPAGERRDVAAGVERWLRGRRLGLRGGLRVSTLGEARPVASGGFSLAVRAGAYVDAYVARGTEEDRAWGVAARVTY